MKDQIIPKMSRKQAKFLWNTLTPQQKMQFNDMLRKMQNGELQLSKVNVDDNEVIQTIVLDLKDKPRKETAAFAKHFKQPD